MDPDEDQGKSPEKVQRHWIRTQQELRQKVTITDDVSWEVPQADGSAISGKEPLLRVAGLDISFAQSEAEGEEGQRGCDVAALVVLSFPGLELVYEDCIEVELHVPYVSGFLGFREVPAFLTLLDRVATTSFQPQVLLVDGFGLLHPRGCGSASHLGVVSGIPTIGVGKTLVRLDGLSERGVRAECAAAIARQQTSEEGTRAGGSEGGEGHSQSDIRLPLIGSSGGEALGMAVCKAGTSRPIFVSVGHRLSLTTATDIVLACSRHRIPEPIRQADLRSRAYIRDRPRAT